MSLYFGTTEITGLYFGDNEITGLYFGDTEIWAAWATYDGTLPAQYSANGDYLADYRIYGSAGGVGDRTENLWDESYPGFEITVIVHYEPIYVGGGEFTLSTDMPFYGTFADLFFLSGNVSIGASSATNSVYLRQSRTMQAIDGYVTIAYRQYDSTYPDVRNYHTMLVKGSTAAAAYVPYGYAVPMSVSDGATSTTTPIYIGDTPLGEDEYVDYREQKVYRCPNLLDMSALESGYLSNDGLVHTPSSASMATDYMEVMPGEYVLNVSREGTLSSGNVRWINYYGASKNFLGYESYYPSPILKDTSYTFAISNPNIKYVRITLDVSYTKAVYHIANPVPTDPPVPLPALPTVDGTTITDYAGQSAALSRFYAKYRKG